MKKLFILFLILLPQFAFACSGSGSPMVWKAAGCSLLVASALLYIWWKINKQPASRLLQLRQMIGWMIPLHFVLYSGLGYFGPTLCMQPPRETYIDSLLSSAILPTVFVFLACIIVFLFLYIRYLSERIRTVAADTLIFAIIALYVIFAGYFTYANVFIIPDLETQDIFFHGAPPAFVPPVSAIHSGTTSAPY